MPALVWDASSVSKRYVEEQGSETVDALLFSPLVRRMAFTFTGYGECHSILMRGFNRGVLTRQQYGAAQTLLRLETLDSLRFDVLAAEEQIFASIPLIHRHHLNATDAAILAAFLDYRVTLPPEELPAVLVASDHRLLRAAQAEGLATLDPETVGAADVSTFLQAL